MPVEKHLPDNQFNNIIRLVKMADLERVKHIKTATFLALKRLKAKRRVVNAKRKIPKGSDQVDIGSFITWMSKVQAVDKKAIEQIVSIDATACRRVEG